MGHRAARLLRLHDFAGSDDAVGGFAPECRVAARGRGRMDRIAGRRSLDFGGVASDSAGVADDRTRLGRSRETSGPAARRTERGFRTARCLGLFRCGGAFAGGCGYAGSDPRDSRTTRIAGSQYHRVSDGRIGFRTARSHALPAGGVVYGRGRGGADAHPGLDESRRGKVRDVACDGRPVHAGCRSRAAGLRSGEKLRRRRGRCAATGHIRKRRVSGRRGGRLYACRDGPGNGEV